MNQVPVMQFQLGPLFPFHYPIFKKCPKCTKSMGRFCSNWWLFHHSQNSVTRWDYIAHSSNVQSFAHVLGALQLGPGMQEIENGLVGLFMIVF